MSRTPPTPADPDAVRARYRAERDRRLRPDGSAQYRAADGAHLADPYADPGFTRPSRHDKVDAVVVGGGFGGLLAAARLRQAGLERVRVIEKGGDFGGTWYWNRYPGIHCDVESYIYLPLLEELGYVPEWKYSPGAEILRHCQAIGRHFGLYRDACFQTAVEDLRWDEDRTGWTVRTDRGDVVEARFVVVSHGTLDRPKLPGVPGLETFRGHTFHTSRWDYGYTGGDAGGGLTGLADQRVALIGTGATAIQVVPHLGRDAGQLYVFQRTPSTVDVRGNRRTDPEWARSLEPGWQQARRDNFLTVITGGRVEHDLVADAWTGSARLLDKLVATDAYRDRPVAEHERAGEEADLRKMHELRERITAEVRDPETAEALKPWYRYLCKRPTFSDHYLPTFNRPNVTLVDAADHGGVERITERAVVVGGREYEVDCIIFATGFTLAASDPLTGRLPIHGRDGVALLEHWRDGIRTLHGCASHGFPNLFHVGPLQNSSSVNFVHGLDQQATHLREIVAEARARGLDRIEPTAEAEAAWVETIRAHAPDRHQFQLECTPGYYNNEGRPRRSSASFGDGPLAFQELLRKWRSNGGFDEIMAPSPVS
ncbi:NAD(P)/FAD-dependent oxidoreductase [Amycolatopsis sp. PS_44_ISF1]|uniref:flavin-containing monooxygenase n=1 Tax=Amycolatopsis sp. PS_44_ISF1 TaxID=2974917 RepID=UPI0028DF23B8|nr:NAD(P)/FAD-dependent oxidoreductase [Amycolatopsis sp. PS_44_ISF1]MDT8913313.1 NAD(P)/FAD-dependent oxidoreductase [Amycolatopsis sp. PS_44_ISF1]